MKLNFMLLKSRVSKLRPVFRRDCQVSVITAVGDNDMLPAVPSNNDIPSSEFREGFPLGCVSFHLKQAWNALITFLKSFRLSSTLLGQKCLRDLLLIRLCFFSSAQDGICVDFRTTHAVKKLVSVLQTLSGPRYNRPAGCRPRGCTEMPVCSAADTCQLRRNFTSAVRLKFLFLLIVRNISLFSWLL